MSFNSSASKQAGGNFLRECKNGKDDCCDDDEEVVLVFVLVVVVASSCCGMAMLLKVREDDDHGRVDDDGWRTLKIQLLVLQEAAGLLRVRATVCRR